MPHATIYVSTTSFRTLSHEAIADVWELFDYSDGDGNATRTLLLSVTPYRMLTLSGFGLCQKKLT
jgi:hypothetical protein